MARAAKRKERVLRVPEVLYGEFMLVMGWWKSQGEGGAISLEAEAENGNFLCGGKPGDAAVWTED